MNQSLILDLLENNARLSSQDLADILNEDEASIKIRIWNAKRELEYKDNFDFVIKNKKKKKAYKELEKAVNSKK